MDKTYWQKYYRKHITPVKPSRFARYVMRNCLEPGQKLIELGCGNGRDANFFASKGVEVMAIDQASTEIDELLAKNPYKNLRYTKGDFTRLEDERGGYDVVYSRFTLHSVSRDEQTRTLLWSVRNLRPGGYLCIEVRGQRNSLFRVGSPVKGESDAYIYNDHYRRFINKSQLDKDISALNMEILVSNENRGYAPFGGDDDYFIRHISRAKQTKSQTN